MKKALLIIILVIVAVVLLYYFTGRQKDAEGEIEPEESGPAAIPNPAAVYCLEQGGKTEVFEFDSGQDAYCVFGDGSLCWEWDFYNGLCDKNQLKISVLQEGAGRPAEKEDTVVVHYTGTLSDGTPFDSSLEREEPFSFVLGAENIIDGWNQGLLGMRIGEKREIVLGPKLAYGEEGSGIIPANATLIFQVELLELSEGI